MISSIGNLVIHCLFTLPLASSVKGRLTLRNGSSGKQGNDDAHSRREHEKAPGGRQRLAGSLFIYFDSYCFCSPIQCLCMVREKHVNFLAVNRAAGISGDRFTVSFHPYLRTERND